jgi:hypothetical protein
VQDERPEDAELPPEGDPVGLEDESAPEGEATEGEAQTNQDYIDGYNVGYDDGEDDGRKDGFREGVSAGSPRIFTLEHQGHYAAGPDVDETSFSFTTADLVLLGVGFLTLFTLGVATLVKSQPRKSNW